MRGQLLRDGVANRVDELGSLGPAGGTRSWARRQLRPGVRFQREFPSDPWTSAHLRGGLE